MHMPFSRQPMLSRVSITGVKAVRLPRHHHLPDRTLHLWFRKHGSYLVTLRRVGCAAKVKWTSGGLGLGLGLVLVLVQ